MGLIEDLQDEVQDLTLRQLVALGILLGGVFTLIVLGVKWFIKYFGQI